MSGSAGVVLAGGRSSRMGRPKAALDWHGSTLLRHVTGVVGRGVDGPVIVAGAAGQELPELADEVVVCEDVREGLGPIEGLAVGLRAASAHAEVAFVCSTDLPFLHSALVRAVLAGLATAEGEETEIVAPLVGGFRQPLAAAYRTALAPRVEALIDQGERRLGHVLDQFRVRLLDEESLLADPTLAAVDPELASVLNVNDPEEYQRARRRPEPQVNVERDGELAADGEGSGRQFVRAATLGRAAGQVGLTLDGRVAALVNGDRVPSDGAVPLLAGDRVTFCPAPD